MLVGAELKKVPGTIDGRYQDLWTWLAFEDEKREDRRMI
jgi:hypothetical protein